MNLKVVSVYLFVGASILIYFGFYSSGVLFSCKFGNSQADETLVWSSKTRSLTEAGSKAQEFGSACTWRGGVFVVASTFRVGSTVLYNLVRLIAELSNPNTVSGYDIKPELVEKWRSLGVPVVIKTHAFTKLYAKSNVTAVFTAHRVLITF